MALNNYIEDDWNDNALTGRTDPVKDVFYEYSTGGTGDLLKGVYRPRWNVIEGSVTTTSGRLSLFSGSQGTVTTTSGFKVGSWSFDWKYSSSTSDNIAGVQWGETQSGGTNSLGIDNYVAGDEFKIIKRESGSGTNLIVGSAITSSTEIPVEATRSSYGDLELFKGGTSQGTATDPYSPKVNYFMFTSNGTGVDFNPDNLVIQ